MGKIGKMFNVELLQKMARCGAPGGKLVPGSNKSLVPWTHSHHTHFSRGDQRIRDVIPVSDSLWKDTTFLRFCAS